MSKQNKFIIWCVLVAITSFWMWVGIQGWFQGSLFEISSRTNLVVISSLFTFLLVLLSLGLIFFQNRLWSVYMGLVSAITYLTVFGIDNVNLVGAFILVMLFYHAQDIVHGEMQERIKMNSRLLIRKGLTNFIVGFFVLISFAAYQSPAIESFKNLSELPSATSVFIRQITEQTLEGQLAQVEPAQKEVILNQVTQEIIREANLFFRPYFQYIPPVLSFGLFLVLWGVGWIFVWLTILFGLPSFQLLQKTKFFKIEEYDTKAQKIVV